MIYQKILPLNDPRKMLRVVVEKDKETDILTVIFSDRFIEESDEAKPGMIFDYDDHGNIVSIENFNASKRVSDFDKFELNISLA